MIHNHHLNQKQTNSTLVKVQVVPAVIRLSLEREVQSSNHGRVKSDTVLPTTHHITAVKFL